MRVKRKKLMWRQIDSIHRANIAIRQSEIRILNYIQSHKEHETARAVQANSMPIYPKGLKVFWTLIKIFYNR
jgi:hypothetical protein